MSDVSELVERLRGQAAALSEGPMTSTMEQRVEWQAADMLERLEAERDKAQRSFDIKAAHAEAWQPCPGHRGKIDTRKDGCPWCAVECLTFVQQRTEAQAAKAQALLSLAEKVLDAFNKWTEASIGRDRQKAEAEMVAALTDYEASNEQD